jgi:hypothetical protein
MAKITLDPAKANSSYTAFFLLATVTLAFVITKTSPDLSLLSGWVVACYALLLYFLWDFIKQLYSPGQSVLLFALVFIVLPAAMNYTLDYPYAFLGLIILIGAEITAGISEVLYESVLKKRFTKKTVKRLLKLDHSLDKSLVELNGRHLALHEYRGIIFGVLLVAAYFIGSYMLLHQ